MRGGAVNRPSPSRSVRRRPRAAWGRWRSAWWRGSGEGGLDVGERSAERVGLWMRKVRELRAEVGGQRRVRGLENTRAASRERQCLVSAVFRVGMTLDQPCRRQSGQQLRHGRS